MDASTDLEASVRLLAEGEERLLQQSELIEKLTREGKPTEDAVELLGAIQSTLNEIQTHIDYLRQTADRRE